MRTHHGGLHFPLVTQHVLHLIALYTLAHNHHLLVLAVKEGYISVRQHIAEVTTAINATAIEHRSEIGIFRHIALIAEGDAVTEDTDFTRFAVFHGL